MVQRVWAIVVVVALGACGAASKGGSGTDATDGTDTGDSTDAEDGTDATDGTDGTDTGDGTDGTDDLYAQPAVKPPPTCKFGSTPLGAVCNPYPGCESACPTGYNCAIATTETGNSLRCIKVGTVVLGGVCDPMEGPYCKLGSCFDNECRASCIDDSTCESAGSSCKQVTTLPGKPSICGKSQTQCEPTTPDEGCGEGESCVLLVDDTSDCRVAGTAKQGEACKTTADCAGGFTCQDGDLGLTCALICHITSPQPDFACAPACAETDTPKILSIELAACVTTPPPVPCDIFLQDCDDLVKACYPAVDKQGFVTGSFCFARGDKTAGVGCQYINECNISTFCIGSPDDPNGTCKRACDPTDATNKLCQTGAAATCEDLGVGFGYCNE